MSVTQCLLFFASIELSALSSGSKSNNFKFCKLTISGYEYAGTLGRSKVGYRCKPWDTKHSARQVAEELLDENFIDGSRKLAKNYCRNPNNNPNGPWCYTSNPDVKIDYCDVPLCLFSGCRVSSIGSEYGGTLSKSVSGLECQPWKISKSDEKSNSAFPEANFPSGSLGPEGRSCRNPNGYAGGPWCWVKPDSKALENEGGFTDAEGTELAAELCDVPFCKEPDCISLVNGDNRHSHYISLPVSSQNLTLLIKPWLKKKWEPNKDGHFAKIFLSTSPSPYSAGFELKIPLYGRGTMELLHLGFDENRDGTHLVMGAEESEDENYIIKKLINWSLYQIVWSSESFAVYKIVSDGGSTSKNESQIQLFYEPKDSKSSKEQEEDLKNIKYISLAGQAFLWSISCDESICPVHTITDSGLHHWERLRLAPTGTHVKFSVRAFGVIGIVLASAPAHVGPRLKILIGENNVTQISYADIEDTQETYSYTVIENGASKVVVNFWEWKEYTISLFGDRIGVYSIAAEDPIGQSQSLLETRQSAARLMRWFSPYSPNGTVSHWTFFCTPEEDDEVPEALPPECITSVKGRASEGYVGSQSVTRSGYPCLPWVTPRVAKRLSTIKYHFPDPTPRDALNFCRNPTRGPFGPWCYRLMVKDVRDSSGHKQLWAEECGVRLCRYADCRMSGIGTDYIGKMNKTISGRECQRWDSPFPHKIPEALQNSSLYADQNITSANNFCRNPTRNNAGPWCYTNDPLSPTDVCDVRDCVKPETCTVLVRGVGEGRLLYVLPHWKTQGLSMWLKEWDPDLADGLVLILRPSVGTRFYKLVVGADGNQKVKLFYKNETGLHLMKEKTVHYVVPAGRWGGFLLRIGHGWLSFSYQGVESQRLFEWTHRSDENTPSSELPFTPLFFTFTSYIGHTIGLYFHCWECHVEETSTASFTKLLPIRRPINSTQSDSKQLEFLIRGTGIALIPLMRHPGQSDYHGVTIGERKGNVTYLVRKTPKARIKVIARGGLPGKLFSEDRWTRFTISFNETNIRLYREEQVLIDFTSPNETMMFYWFSLGAENGEITWAANCDPPDIDGAPRDGGWSTWGSWQCSVSCGGGVGRRERHCVNPAPNVFGMGCEGPPMSEGPCNDFPCGLVSPDTVDRLRENFRRKHASVVAEEGDDVLLPCGNFTGKLLQTAHAEATNSTIGWTKDGVHLVDRQLLDNHDIMLKGVSAEDSGVYLCLLWQKARPHTFVVKEEKNKTKGIKNKIKGALGRLKGKITGALKFSEDLNEVETPLALSLVSLAVIRKIKNHKPTLSVSETRITKLPCKAIALGLVYGDLRVQWNINGSLWKDYGFVSPDLVYEESLVVGKEHRGEWTCVVSQPDLRFTWITNWIRLEVRPPPNFFSMLMEDSLTAPIFKPLGSEKMVIFVFFGILTLLLLLICASKYVVIRYLNSKRVD